MLKVDVLADNLRKICKKKGWDLDWSNGGCYLHLEASEFIEALRGKKSDPKKEAADVLFMLFAMAQEHGIKPSEILAELVVLATNLDTKD